MVEPSGGICPISPSRDRTPTARMAIKLNVDGFYYRLTEHSAGRPLRGLTIGRHEYFQLTETAVRAFDNTTSRNSLAAVTVYVTSGFPTVPLLPYRCRQPTCIHPSWGYWSSNLKACFGDYRWGIFTCGGDLNHPRWRCWLGTNVTIRFCRCRIEERRVAVDIKPSATPHRRLKAPVDNLGNKQCQHRDKLRADKLRPEWIFLDKLFKLCTNTVFSRCCLS